MTEKVLRCDDDKHAHKQTHSCYGDCYKSCSLNSGSLILSKSTNLRSGISSSGFATKPKICSTMQMISSTDNHQ